MAERWWEDFDGYAARLLDARRARSPDVCRLALELEPDLAPPLRRLHELRPRRPPRLAPARPRAPGARPGEPGDELVRVYEAVDRACGELIEAARRRSTARSRPRIVLSDHGMKPIYWMFHANRWLEEAGHLRYRRRSLQRLKGGALNALAKVDQRLARTTRRYARALDLVPVPAAAAAEDRAFADIDFGSTRAYCFATGGQIFLGEASGARERPPLRRPARRGARGDPAPGDRRAGVRREAQGGALPRPVPRQGARARHPAARRAHPRRLVPPAVADAPSSATSTLDPEHLLRLLGPPRPDRHPRRGRARASARAGAGGRRDHAASGHAPAACSASSVEGLDGAPIDDDPRDAGGRGAPSRQAAEPPRPTSASTRDEEEAAWSSTSATSATSSRRRVATARSRPMPGIGRGRR